MMAYMTQKLLGLMASKWQHLSHMPASEWDLSKPGIWCVSTASKLAWW